MHWLACTNPFGHAWVWWAVEMVQPCTKLSARPCTNPPACTTLHRNPPACTTPACIATRPPSTYAACLGRFRCFPITLRRATTPRTTPLDGPHTPGAGTVAPSGRGRLGPNWVQRPAQLVCTAPRSCSPSWRVLVHRRNAPRIMSARWAHLGAPP